MDTKIKLKYVYKAVHKSTRSQLRQQIKNVNKNQKNEIKMRQQFNKALWTLEIKF